ncbi:50S ribosomal protein L13 [Candidatus Pacearchaeota archaeon]|nr:MAG: 50S ribosomal protein L13 [Candidatus Pacearchaeota archaeon]
MTSEEIVIDGKGAVLGRLASFAAKQALLGKKVVVVNCNEVVITGRKENVVENYRAKRARGGSSLKGPHFPRQPERIVKRTIRGMLPYKQGRGRTAFKSVRCFDALPAEFASKEKLSLGKELKTTSIKLGELARLI